MSSEKGVTLVEVMMAVTVLAVAIVGLLTSIASAQRANLLFEEERIALDAAMDKLEEIRGETFGSISGSYGVGSPQLDFFDPRTGQTRAYNGAARTGGEESWFAVWMSGTNTGPYALAPPVDPNGSMSHPHGQIILVTSQNANENAFANPFPVDLDGQDSSGDGNGRNDNPAQIGFNPGTGGMLVAVVVRWRSAATGRNGEVALRTVVVER